ncbi:MAG: class I SAM-dependent methyltransferase [Chloroflexi bacterium]|jgi:SAM-dependent methyltransferase|nr:class I SAM-dependent methyltransferase [Chloroflexota bacterium]MBK6713315.1 class I SAM-dependent methyltransferase [Chloroflexota bacterium]MBK7918311.1 class I SAM-dependent methyltransferase [Chloroflexota bacterium]MBK8933008.1 class I SAM-dependent methyltransferase [Chloroflexota bacterium]MBP6802971.1 class I SAM-dependent methyltransferase [Chloroflexota bacterium]
MAEGDELFDRLQSRYEEGRVPWDDEMPPPEVVQIAASLPPGRALDLGCGYGRSSIYLARRNWVVDGVDFIPLAIAGALARAEMAGVAEKANFHLGRVTHLPFLSGPYDFALDVGCMHALDDAGLRQYRDEVYRLLRSGGLYLLFAHLRSDEAEVPGRGVYEATLHSLFGSHFTLEKVVHGTTQVENRPPFASAWFWFRRN